MSGFLPARRSKWWFVVFFVYAVALFAFLALTRGMLPGRNISTAFISAAAILSLVIALIACLFGYLNAKIVFVVTTAGVLAGMIMMVVAYISKNGWKDLIGPILFIELSLLGFAGGVLIEVIYFIYSVTRDKKKKSDTEKKSD